MHIYNFTDYRAFIKFSLNNNPNLDISLTVIAAKLGVKKPYLSQVISGSKNFSLEQGFFFSQCFQLSTSEARYFNLMIALSRARTAKYKEAVLSEMNHQKQDARQRDGNSPRKGILSDQEQSIFYSSWQYSAVHLASGINTAQTPLQIADTLGIDVDKVQQVLSFLISTELCKTDGNKYSPNVNHIHLPPDSTLAWRNHTNWRLKAIDYLAKSNSQNLFFNYVIRIDEPTFTELKANIKALINEITVKVENAGDNRLACINFDCFKL